MDAFGEPNKVDFQGQSSAVGQPTGTVSVAKPGLKHRLLAPVRTPARILLGAAVRARRTSKLSRDFLWDQKRSRLKTNQVFYESHVGAGLICNPLAIFRELLQDPKRRSLRHVWVLNSDAELFRMQEAYKGHRNVRFVLRDSREYIRALATSKYIIQNTSYPTFFSKRPGQICVDTWHSTTIKTLGFDMPDGNIQSRNIIRSLLMSDYVVSPNPFMTKIFRESYRLQNLFQGKILELGYPRNDLTFAAERDAVIRDLQSRGVKVDPSKKIILFAPTWRGDSAAEATSDAESLRTFYNEVSARIDTDQYQLLIKPHHLTDAALSPEEKASGNYVPRQVETNELLAAVDVLVSDYSSIYIDYLITDRPILFYIPDKDAYDESRGVYFDFDELPGPVTADLHDIADWINRIDVVSNEFSDRRAAVKAWACPHEDGQASGRAVRAVFDGDHSTGVIDDFEVAKKKRVLFYVSSLSPNGVTASFRALLNEMDFDEFDVTVWGSVRKDESPDGFRALRGVRAMPRIGAFVHSLWEALGVEYVSHYGLHGFLAKILRPQKALRREFSRCFGDAQFDYLIDYSGYGLIFPNILRQVKGAKTIIWQHSDLAADIGNDEKRKLARYKKSKATIVGFRDTYDAFDKIVACGAPVMELNRAALATAKTYDKFTFVNNMVDVDRVKTLSNVAVPESRDQDVEFVTIGRLSPEKNQANLIKGFARFTQDFPKSRLLILGGGELQGSLENLAKQLGVADRVTLTGRLDNPYAMAARADCFILPSRYEGFGLAALEARVLGLPIILSQFPAADSVSIPGGQYSIGFSAEDIASGMRAFVEGDVPSNYKFDAKEHNLEALGQFRAMLTSA